jgi:hypothetical protein
MHCRQQIFGGRTGPKPAYCREQLPGAIARGKMGFGGQAIRAST